MSAKSRQAGSRLRGEDRGRGGFPAGFDGLMMQHLPLPDEEAERIYARALVSAVQALAEGRRLDPAVIPAEAG
ncbi:hypothetical protein ACFZDB_24405 [Streptomyces luteogriseus]|uniref:hypothetical protein n=1 Tax=Streptomyces luteogriseus TaxID=68233 RepID=UPI0036951CDF